METTLAIITANKRIRISVSAFGMGMALALSSAFAAGFPTGTFEGKELPITVSFDTKGHFSVSQGATLGVTGTYTAKADQISLTDAQGPWACTSPGQQTGIYTWKFENGALLLSKLADQCGDRAKTLASVTWQLKK
jgi:hypothetical protein